MGLRSDSHALLSFALGIAISSLVYDLILVLLGFIAAIHPRAGDLNFTIWLLVSMVVIVCILWPLLFMLINRVRAEGGL